MSGWCNGVGRQCGAANGGRAVPACADWRRLGVLQRERSSQATVAGAGAVGEGRIGEERLLMHDCTTCFPLRPGGAFVQDVRGCMRHGVGPNIHCLARPPATSRPPAHASRRDARAGR